MSLGSQTFEFVDTPLVFEICRVEDLFAQKNNKSVGETICHPKYHRLASLVRRQYPESIERRLGEFLYDLKQHDDLFYREFLNTHGDGEYFEFRLEDPNVRQLKGLYCFTVDRHLKYIGKSTDTFGKRINQGYGKIHPKNCYRDGQSTNCHLNGLIALTSDQVRLHIHPMRDDDTIEFTERALILRYEPEWNFQLRGRLPSPMGPATPLET